MAKPVKPKPVTARELLRPSILRQTQREAMGDDVDVTDLYFTLNAVGIDIEHAVLDATIERTIEGASTLTVTVYDRDFVLLRSGRLSSRNDTQIDGLYFRLTGVRMNGHNLELTFEDREVAILRTYSKPIKQSAGTGRGQVTRAEFILRMLREVQEVNIPYIIPELHKEQPIDGAKTNAPLRLQDNSNTNKSGGIAKQNICTIKGTHMKEYQRKIANAVIDVGASQKIAKRPILVMGIMCAIQETTMNNPQPSFPPNPNEPVGVFQQFKKWGWPATGNIEIDGKAFYDKLIPIYSNDQSRNYAYIIEDVQRSYPGAGAVLAGQVINSRNEWAMKTYGTRRDEAEQIVTAYGFVESTAEANQQWNAQGGQSFQFYRGATPTSKLNKQKYGGTWGPETSWHAIQRLADEVHWRAFFVSGTFYYLSEENLIKSQPVATIDHSTAGIDSISGNYDEGSKAADLTIECRMGRWAAPPGSVVQVVNMGPWNGRWIVNDVTRSLFDSKGTVVLKKLYPRLPEPSGTNIIKGGDQSFTNLPKQPDQTGGGIKTQTTDIQGTKVFSPVGKELTSIGAYHDTLGLPGYPAKDFMAPTGSIAVAPIAGTVTDFSGYDPALGPIKNGVPGGKAAAGGPLGWSIYIRGVDGNTYYLTHMGSRTIRLLEKVVQFQPVGTVADYASWGRGSHIHMGVHTGIDYSH